jgi:ubiquinol-cytochrome c reductase cytochrome c1 subunit
VQRGYQVYKQVCASCHSMKLLSYRNLGDKGGPFYDPEYPNPNENPFVKALAAENTVTFLNADGDEDSRTAVPADGFRQVYANEAKARAANAGALPPDLSVITKARVGGASYVYSLLMGYPEESAFSQRERPPTATEKAADEAAAKAAAEAAAAAAATPVPAIAPAAGTEPAVALTPVVVAPVAKKYFDTIIDVSKLEGGKKEGHSSGVLLQPPGQYYNPYFPGDTTPNYSGDPRHPPPGGFLAMTDPLAPQVGNFEYTDGTKATKAQMAKDVAQFLAWAGEPKMPQRKSLGLPVMIYLGLLAILVWFSYKRIWRNVEH